MAFAQAEAGAPRRAERVRTIVSTADSLSVVTASRDYDLLGAGLHSVDDHGRIFLTPPTDSVLTAEVCTAPHGSLSVLLKFTDLAPVALRERVRSRVTLAGWLTRAGTGPELRLDTAQAAFENSEATWMVPLDEITAAAPDPLAPYEAGMLTHLVDDHHDVLDSLTRLLDRRSLLGVNRILPLALDRHGLTLRLERPAAHQDVRLNFPSVVRTPAEAGDGIQALLGAARRCPRGGRLPSRP